MGYAVLRDSGMWDGIDVWEFQSACEVQPHTYPSCLKDVQCSLILFRMNIEGKSHGFDLMLLLRVKMLSVMVY